MATDLTREVASLVLAKMGENEVSKHRLSTLTNIPLTTLRRKLAGRADFTFEELYLVADALGTSPSAFVPRAFRAAAA